MPRQIHKMFVHARGTTARLLGYTENKAAALVLRQTHEVLERFQSLAVVFWAQHAIELAVQLSGISSRWTRRPALHTHHRSEQNEGWT